MHKIVNNSNSNYSSKIERNFYSSNSIYRWSTSTTNMADLVNNLQEIVENRLNKNIPFNYMTLLVITTKGWIDHSINEAILSVGQELIKNKV